MVSLIDASLNPAGDTALFTDRQWLEALLRFEAGLADAQAGAGLIPPTAAAAISGACAAVEMDRAEFIECSRRTGALGIGLVDPLKAYLALHAPEALPYLHWGATTQDAVDTAHALLTKAALSALLEELEAMERALCTLARDHAATPMLARSLMQPAQLTSFGLKCAQSAAAFRRSINQFAVLAPRALCVQLGGAVGNRAALGKQAADVERRLAGALGLWVCGYSWHTQRDAWIRLGMEAAVCAGSMAKLARDWSLMSQFEVGELAEATRGRTSSAMPHKRNPVYCMQAIAQTQAVPGLAAALLGAMAQAHERALGEWQSELTMWAPLWRHVHGAAAALRRAAEGLRINTVRMQAHVDALHEVVFSEACAKAITPVAGQGPAQQAVEGLAAQALAQGVPLSGLLLNWVEAHYGALQAESVAPALARATDQQRAVDGSAACCALLLETLEAPSHTRLEPEMTP
ncbi:fumarate lyase [Allopusillimonas soli]|uniref:Fumarate lyase n=1 Tax=Allopusillimonas soli TaxID=659016 RepID=A0A853F4K7_9BURK|nr:lyase family protein [Allopusillimonas soli]NYT35444.1 fumarate lyase [Allopusillimonas soli]TEA75859.1 fumarate lyase [Allopusillimonas soli]